MKDLELPINLVRDISDDDVHGPARHAWLAELRQVIDDLVDRWSLRVGPPFQPGGSASWVAPAHTATGDRVVLKLAWRHHEAEHEADGLSAWNGNGTVRLLDTATTTSTNALLLEACEPGTPLAHAMPAHDQDVVIAGLLRRLWIDPPPGHPFRALRSMCEQWASGFEARYAAARARGLDVLDPALAVAGIELLRQLPATATRSVLLCTDLHHDNVLAAAREPWLVIDPKPYLGDPTYDPLQHMLNFPDRLADDARTFTRRMAQLLDLDPDRLQLWLFARCVQESLDSPNLGDVAIQLAP
jgi:streptomycin 6-kinase